jgi:hypothetical protein
MQLTNSNAFALASFPGGSCGWELGFVGPGPGVPPSARKVEVSPSRPLLLPGDLMEQFNPPLQRDRQG